MTLIGRSVDDGETCLLHRWNVRPDGHILGHKTNRDGFKRTEITQGSLAARKGINPEIRATRSAPRCRGSGHIPPQSRDSAPAPGAHAAGPALPRGRPVCLPVTGGVCGGRRGRRRVCRPCGRAPVLTSLRLGRRKARAAPSPVRSCPTPACREHRKDHGPSRALMWEPVTAFVTSATRSTTRSGPGTPAELPREPGAEPGFRARSRAAWAPTHGVAVAGKGPRASGRLPRSRSTLGRENPASRAHASRADRRPPDREKPR